VSSWDTSHFDQLKPIQPSTYIIPQVTQSLDIHNPSTYTIPGLTQLMQVGCSVQLLLLGSRLVAAISLVLLLSLLLLLPPCLALANLPAEACLALLSLLPPQVSIRPMALALNQHRSAVQRLLLTTALLCWTRHSSAYACACACAASRSGFHQYIL